jgi:hypothetical protein
VATYSWCEATRTVIALLPNSPRGAGRGARGAAMAGLRRYGRLPRICTFSPVRRSQNPSSGPGQLYLANPYTVAASAITGYITPWEPPPPPTAN